jgi:hypothetical protein
MLVTFNIVRRANKLLSSLVMKSYKQISIVYDFPVMKCRLTEHMHKTPV